MSRFLSKFAAGAAGAGVSLMDTAIKEQMLKAREKRMAALEEQRHKRDRAEQLADHKRDRAEQLVDHERKRKEALADFEREQNARLNVLREEYDLKQKLQGAKEKAKPSKVSSSRFQTVTGADGRLYRVDKITGAAFPVFISRALTPEEKKVIQQRKHDEVAAVAPYVAAPADHQPVPNYVSSPLRVSTNQDKKRIMTMTLPDGSTVPVAVDPKSNTYTPMIQSLSPDLLTPAQ